LRERPPPDAQTRAGAATRLPAQARADADRLEAWSPTDADPAGLATMPERARFRRALVEARSALR
jgi:hypothetical protein